MKKIKLMLMLVVLSGILMAVGCSKEKDTPAPVTPPTPPPPTSTCPTGYTGANCETQITPSKIIISKIQVTKFPQYDGVSNWDNLLDVGGVKPELFIQLSSGSTVLFGINELGAYFQDASYNIIYEFNSTNFSSVFPYTLFLPTFSYKIEALDYDSSSPHDTMGTLYFTPYNSSNGFPSVLIVTSSNLEFKIYVTYIF